MKRLVQSHSIRTLAMGLAIASVIGGLLGLGACVGMHDLSAPELSSHSEAALNKSDTGRGVPIDPPLLPHQLPFALRSQLSDIVNADRVGLQDCHAGTVAPFWATPNGAERAREIELSIFVTARPDGRVTEARPYASDRSPMDDEWRGALQACLRVRALAWRLPPNRSGFMTRLPIRFGPHSEIHTPFAHDGSQPRPPGRDDKDPDTELLVGPRDPFDRPGNTTWVMHDVAAGDDGISARTWRGFRLFHPGLPPDLRAPHRRTETR